MKLRIQGNSLRLRLSRSEVSELNHNLIIDETTDFGSSKLHYVLRASTDESDIYAAYKDQTIEVRVPRALAQDWANTDRVSISADQLVGSGKTLEVLIEKDFKCLHKTSDANQDAYPNPLEQQMK